MHMTGKAKTHPLKSIVTKREHKELGIMFLTSYQREKHAGLDLIMSTWNIVCLKEFLTLY